MIFVFLIRPNILFALCVVASLSFVFASGCKDAVNDQDAEALLLHSDDLGADWRSKTPELIDYEWGGDEFSDACPTIGTAKRHFFSESKDLTFEQASYVLDSDAIDNRMPGHSEIAFKARFKQVYVGLLVAQAVGLAGNVAGDGLEKLLVDRSEPLFDEGPTSPEKDLLPWPLDQWIDGPKRHLPGVHPDGDIDYRF